MSETILTITAENFEKEVLQSALPVLVDFWAPWCVYCRRIEPAVEELAEDTEGKLVVGKVNVDEQEALADRFGVETIPVPETQSKSGWRRMASACSSGKNGLWKGEIYGRQKCGRKNL